MPILKITAFGDVVALILPAEVMAHLNVKMDDELYLSEAPGNAYYLTANHPEFKRQMVVAENIMREDCAVLHDLATGAEE